MTMIISKLVSYYRPTTHGKLFIHLFFFCSNNQPILVLFFFFFLNGREGREEDGSISKIMVLKLYN